MEENTMKREELREKFRNELPLNFMKLHEDEKDKIFDFFWAELDNAYAREKTLNNLLQVKLDKIDGLCKQLDELEQLLKLADNVEVASHNLMMGLSKDGNAIEGFTNAWNANLAYRKLKLEHQIDTTLKP